MRKVKIGWRKSESLRRLLRVLAGDGGVRPDWRANANYWAGATTRKMDRRELQAIAWLLLSISNLQTVTSARREAARLWATYLEAVI